MRLTLPRSIAALATVLIFGSSPGMAQPTVSATKKELVQKVLMLNRPAIEGIGTQLAGQTASDVLQAASPAVGRLPDDRREKVAGEVQAEVRKFFDEVAPLLRERAIKLAPATLGAALEAELSEDELKSLIAWLESPVSRKYQKIAGESGQSLRQKLVDDSRSAVEPKLKALDQSVAAKLKAATPAPKPSSPAPKK